MWQRTALNVCRANDLPINMKGVLIPYWQVIAGWPTMLIKGTMLILIWIFSKWYVPITIFITDLFLTAVIPIPHSFFLSKMQKRLESPTTSLIKKEFTGQNEEIKRQLLEAVTYVRNKYKI